MADRFDLDAIEADDALLDLLAAGGETAWAAAEHDPALMLLAELRLAVEVEDELPVESIDDPESFLARCAALNPVNDQFAKKMAARGLALGVAAVAALSVSGVAAAVNGDPLSPYEKVIDKVVDGLRPQTTVPKEQLDGMPIFDKTKIVKVQKDFQEKQEQQIAAKDAADKNDPGLAGPLDLDGIKPSPLNRPIPAQVEKPTTTKDPVQPPVVDPTKPADPDPGGQPTDEPTDPPSDPPSDPPTEPTTPPTEPTDPPTTPTDTPTSEPTKPTDNGQTGEGSNPVDPPISTPTSNPTTVPGDTTGENETGTGQTGNGSTDNGQAANGEGQESGETGDTQPGDSQDSTAPDQSGDAADSGDGTGAVTLSEVLPTPTGEPTELPTRLEQYFGDALGAHGKHSNGKGSLGWAKGKYQAGKHSSGKYPEGKHAAIARAHGSMAPMTLRQILTVLNGPMTDR